MSSDRQKYRFFADGVNHGWWWSSGSGLGPRATDPPAINLAIGGLPGPPYGMGAFTIPRHGSRPSKIPINHQPQDRMPGAINVSFYDGHVETVPLERLWDLSWHRDYVAPAKRPGLQ